ncbi:MULTISPECIES: glycogen/starch/alpha-glucan phosphorylase [unclassified Paenibacillus]|uniref:glycogen/starch/alpha-glucan phosphorylase n=1 Tax=unclassified Paenibacillus TaxID=185978 RepID=UPI0024050301|nr:MULTISPECIES: glycogen/starch/alpha-glucan phosphorylase [unclassified Paenibacillus]MDF9843340.1 starch phosphorylase [Paenibacillus sp. PastF-2]MDF9849928.1 starch phosphorylase [Paenibacillus sp. PastM-2]MDF9856636.1 starch phosphorylase [Paenibacillus sp. PastF-1]MDH6481905.1 starch phosphorylase [Paenibacillus sp. PastH-2]MDH6509331.1 starch phosphorylase [Paenibacillus sp. PastM-3]
MFNDKESFKKVFRETLISKLGKPLEEASNGDVYKILGNMIRENAGMNWAETNQKYKVSQQKQVYYFSMEFLIGRLLGNNLLNMGVLEVVRDGLEELGFNLRDVEEEEADAGLGNGGLGRLAACFLDSLASLQYAGHGCGIRYKYGLFEQKIVDGYQVELPDYWLQNDNVWEVRREDKQVEVRFWGRVETREENGKLVFEHKDYEAVRAVPYDVPVIGADRKHVNTLRNWSAESITPASRMSGSLTGSDYHKFLEYKRSVESISEFLYPDDSQYEGKLLRLKQQYFLCSAGVQSIMRTFSKTGAPIEALPDKVALHINDTHPTLLIPELMRILMDVHGLGWDKAWEMTTRMVSYTNHTILSEALEKWPMNMVKELLPRIFLIIEEINARFCGELMSKYPGDQNRINQMAIIHDDQVRMANLAIVASHSVNGVAALHTEILQKREMRLFNEMYPHRFNNKTNGITHRRWLMHANPELTRLINDSIGTRWIHQPQEMIGLIKYSEDASFQEQVAAIKRRNKLRLAEYITKKHGVQVDPDSIFDVQVKRLHAYKRQLLNILHIMHLYNQLKDNPSMDMVPRTFIFGAKAAPSYHLAKRIIKLINTVADVVNKDPDIKGKIRIFFLENYSVSLAEKIIPAADVSEQISTASKEASGTGNMKFMMNGALTIGTMDGANVEMHEMVGDNNMFLFGLRAEQVMDYYQFGGYRSRDIYYGDGRVKEVLDQLVTPGPICCNTQEFDTLYQSLLDNNDEFFVLKDFASYVETHVKIDLAYRNQREWLKKSIVNIGHSGKFSSDNTISRYAAEIWKINPVG